MFLQHLFSRCPAKKFVYTVYIASVVMLCIGCNKDVIEKQSAEIKTLTSEINSLTSKTDSLNSVVATQSAELKTLKETDKGFFSQGVTYFNNGDLQNAKVAFSEVINRFPSSALLSKAQTRIRAINSKIALNKVTQIKSSLSASDKSTYKTAAKDLASIIQQPIDKISRAQANALLSKVKSMLSKWPVTFDEIKPMKLRFSDLRGKKVLIGIANIKSSDYYNYNFDNDNVWRSFELSTGSYSADKINAYVRKRSKLAEELMENALSSAIAVKNVIVRYPYNCEDNDVIELISCEY